MNVWQNYNLFYQRKNKINILDDPMNRDGWSSLYEKCEDFRIISF